MLLKALCLLLLMTGPAFASSVTLTIPDAKDAVVVRARDLFNARTGQSLNTKQYLMAVIKAAIASELAQKQQADSEAAARAARDVAAAVEKAEIEKIEAATKTETEGAWGLPATPVPTPVPTPTVPVLP